MEPDRLTAQQVELIDADLQQPAYGARVLALTIGGVLVQAVWSKDAKQSFVAWSPFPKVPQAVKDRLSTCSGVA